VKNHKKIAVRYLRSWFILDVVSTFPYEMIANLAMYGSPRPSINVELEIGNMTASEQSVVALKASSSMRLLRLLRIMRLLKLGRIARASRITSRIADRLERYISISYTTRTLCFWTFLMLILIHWFCCVWGLLGQEQGTQRTDELEVLRLATFDTPGARRALAVAKKSAADASSSTGAEISIDEIVNCNQGPLSCLSTCEMQLLAWSKSIDVAYLSKQESWMCRAVLEGKIPSNFLVRHSELYLYLLQASGLIATPESTPEYITYFVLSFLFLIVSNVFVGVVAAAQSEADPQTKEFKSRMDHLNHFLSDMRVPLELKQRTREHFRFTRDLVRKQSYNDLYERFSPRLRGEVLCHISLRTLQAVPYFVGCERGLLNSLSQRLSHHGYAQGEIVNHNDQGCTLSIVTRGTAVRGGKPITLYQYWGEDMIVTSVALRDKRPAAALTYVEIVCLTRSDLLEELQHYTDSSHTIHIAAVNIAMMRAPVLISNYLQQRQLKSNDLFGAMKRLGTSSTAEDREVQAMLKQINGSRPLRGFARELIHDGDDMLKKRSEEAVAAMGADDSKMLVDENGDVMDGTGEALNLETEAEDPIMKAMASMQSKLEARMDADRSAVHRELSEIKRSLALLLPIDIVAQTRAKASPGFRGENGAKASPGFRGENGTGSSALVTPLQSAMRNRRRRQRPAPATAPANGTTPSVSSPEKGGSGAYEA
jgi:hypothetical protein